MFFFFFLISHPGRNDPARLGSARLSQIEFKEAAGESRPPPPTPPPRAELAAADQLGSSVGVLTREGRNVGAAGRRRTERR